MTNTRSGYATSPLPPRARTRRRREKQQRKCLECGQVFYKAEHLARHSRSHTRERPFECELCGKTYTRHDSLLRHTRVHAGRDGELGGSPRAWDPTMIAVISPPASRVGDTITPVDVVQDSGRPFLPRNSSQANDDMSAAPVTESTTHTIYSAPGSHYTPQPMLAQGLDTSGLAASAIAGEHSGTDFAAVHESLFNSSNDLTSMSLGLNPYEPAWLLGSDFDVDALNFSISAAISDWGPQPTADSVEQRRLYAAANTLNRLHMPSPSAETVSQVQQKWHTRMSRAVTPQNSSSAQLPDQDMVDERYREGLSHRLQPRMSNAALPSADFLNLCIKLYFTRFNPVFPIIHAPTFRPSSESALLLLSICSVGALFMGSAKAAAQGRKIFQILNKAILASWENYIRRDGREPLSLAQAATIGQTFGMLSGQPQDLCMTESFHGTVIAWARQAGLFKIRDSMAVLTDDSPGSEIAWRSWAQAEESVRLVLGLYIHDMEFATTFHHEPLLRHTIERLPACCSEELFTAASAAEWHNLVELRRGSDSGGFPSLLADVGCLEPLNRRSHMFMYAMLAGILSSIQEAKASFFDETSTQYFRERLLSWHNDYCKLPRDSKYTPINLMVLWHMAFMCLYTDFDLLERSFGRDGDLQAQEAGFKVRAWASSPEARRGVLHALLVLKHMETIPIGVEPAIHVPKALFYSAVFIHCYTTLGPGANSYISLQDEINVPEFQVSSHTGFPHQGGGRPWHTISSPFDSSTVCSIIDLLRRVGHWEISQRYAAILEDLMDDIAKA